MPREIRQLEINHSPVRNCISVECSLLTSRKAKASRPGFALHAARSNGLDIRHKRMRLTVIHRDLIRNAGSCNPVLKAFTSSRGIDWSAPPKIPSTGPGRFFNISGSVSGNRKRRPSPPAGYCADCIAGKCGHRNRTRRWRCDSVRIRLRFEPGVDRIQVCVDVLGTGADDLIDRARDPGSSRTPKGIRRAT